MPELPPRQPSPPEPPHGTSAAAPRTSPGPHSSSDSPGLLNRLATQLGTALRSWPLLTQLAEGRDGTGAESMTAKTRSLRARTDGTEVYRSVCPFCAVGCGQRVHVRQGRVEAITGDPESPINQGHLCPKGAASHELVTHSRRETRVLYRAPRAQGWTALPLHEAMDMVAARVWSSRRAGWEASDASGRPLQRTQGLAHLGGATLDIEENYLIKKLFTGGLGMVGLSNQARI
jgi:formate dehydrogenase major subunit